MKRLRSQTVLDDIDVAIVEALAADARVPVAELARTVGLSAPSTKERLNRLEDAGLIAGYTIRLDPAAIGLPVAAWLRIRPLPGKLPQVAEILRGIPEVVACDRITGEDCFVARAHVASIEALEGVIDRLIPLSMTNTSIIQSSPVAERLPPLTPGR